MTLTDDAKAVVALTTRLGERSRPSLTAKMWHRLAASLEADGRRPAEVFDHAFDPAAVAGVDARPSSERATTSPPGPPEMRAVECSAAGARTMRRHGDDGGLHVSSSADATPTPPEVPGVPGAYSGRRGRSMPATWGRTVRALPGGGSDGPPLLPSLPLQVPACSSTALSNTSSSRVARTPLDGEDSS